MGTTDPQDADLEGVLGLEEDLLDAPSVEKIRSKRRSSGRREATAHTRRRRSEQEGHIMRERNVVFSSSSEGKEPTAMAKALAKAGIATEPSPFGRALYLARKVSSRQDDTTELQEAVASLDEAGRRNLLWRVIQEVILDGRCRIPAVFAVARAAGGLGLAYMTAAVYKSVHEGGATLEDLQAAGLLETAVSQRDGKTVARTRLRLSRDRLRAAARVLRQRGKRHAAEVLENYLLQGERRKLEAEARREALKASPEGENGATDLPEAENDKDSGDEAES